MAAPRVTARLVLLLLCASGCIFDITEGHLSASGGGGGGGAGGGGGQPVTGGGGATSGGGGEGGEGAMGPIDGHVVAWQIDPNDLDGPPADVRYFDFTTGDPVIEALVETDGEWQSYPGQGDANGRFTIDGVPPGPYLLHINTLWLWLVNRNDVDLERYQIEAFESPVLTDGNAPLAHLRLSNMTGWKDTDNLQIFAPTRNVYGYVDASSPFMPPIPTGATDVDSFIDYRTMTFDNRMVIGGDRTVFFHQGPKGNNPYSSLLDFTEVDFTVPDSDDPFDISATFVPFDPSTTTFELDLDTGSFADLVVDTNPRAVHVDSFFVYSVIAQPYTVQRLSGTADIISHTLAPGTESTHLTYLVGSPFSMDRWRPIVIVAVHPRLSFQLPGLGPADYPGLILAHNCELPPDDPLLDPANGSLEPQIRPPANASVDGFDFFDTTMPQLSGDTPVITWDAPVEEVDRWTLRVVEVTAGAAGQTLIQSQGAFQISTEGSATSLAIPPGVIESGKHYLFDLRGTSCPTCDYQARPRRTVVGTCTSTMVSELFLAP